MKQITKRLRKAYPNATTELNWGNPFELLIATVLSAQT
ncbi:MAG: endonuclease III, partial [Armatimonadota bacterium]